MKVKATDKLRDYRSKVISELMDVPYKDAKALKLGKTVELANGKATTLIDAGLVSEAAEKEPKNKGGK